MKRKHFFLLMMFPFLLSSCDINACDCRSFEVENKSGKTCKTFAIVNDVSGERCSLQCAWYPLLFGCFEARTCGDYECVFCGFSLTELNCYDVGNEFTPTGTITYSTETLNYDEYSFSNVVGFSVDNHYSGLAKIKNNNITNIDIEKLATYAKSYGVDNITLGLKFTNDVSLYSYSVSVDANYDNGESKSIPYEYSAGSTSNVNWFVNPGTHSIAITIPIVCEDDSSSYLTSITNLSFSGKKIKENKE